MHNSDHSLKNNARKHTAKIIASFVATLIASRALAVFASFGVISPLPISNYPEGFIRPFFKESLGVFERD
ncbi:MAG: hypothetical protein R3E54_16560 [Halioglobus sp.]